MEGILARSHSCPVGFYPHVASILTQGAYNQSQGSLWSESIPAPLRRIGRDGVRSFISRGLVRLALCASAVVSMMLGPSLLTAAEALAQSTSPIRLDVDSPETGVSITNGQRVFVGGWAVAPDGPGVGIRSVDVFLDTPQGATAYLGSARLGIVRQDVASVLGNPQWVNSGYNFDWTPRSVPQGPHTLYIVAHSRSGQSITQTVPITSCGCGFVPTLTSPGVRGLGPMGFEVDYGGPGLWVERPNNDDWMGP